LDNRQLLGEGNCPEYRMRGELSCRHYVETEIFLYIDAYRVKHLHTVYVQFLLFLLLIKKFKIICKNHLQVVKYLFLKEKNIKIEKTRKRSFNNICCLRMGG
jgi:hypothetical protein